MTVRILRGDCREVLRTLPDESVHCVVTSPPYWGLRDYGVEGQIGLETTPDAYVAEIVSVLREARRTMCDGATLWLNLGDSYSGSGKGGNPEAGKQATNKGSQTVGTLYGKTGERARQAAVTNVSRRLCAEQGFASKQLMGIPWRVAFALPIALEWGREDGTHQIGFHDQRGKDRNKPTVSGKAASATPLEFRDALIALARAANGCNSQAA